LEAHFDDTTADNFAKLFDQNQLTEVDISELDHDLLSSMKINVAKTRLKILKMKTRWLENKKQATLEEEEIPKKNEELESLAVQVDVKHVRATFEQKIKRFADKSDKDTKKRSKTELSPRPNNS